MELETIPNRAFCLWTKERHSIELSELGLTITITYEPNQLMIEPSSLARYIDNKLTDSYEFVDHVIPDMIQQITQDVADVVGIYVRSQAEIAISRQQKVFLECSACPNGGEHAKTSKVDYIIPQTEEGV